MCNKKETGIKFRFVKVPFALLLNLVIGIGFASSSFADADTEALDDGQIIGIYNQVNTFDIEAALLAMSKGHSQKVRKLVETVSSEHRGVRMMAADLAKTIGVKVSLPSARQDAAYQHYQTMATLAKMEGKDFDRKYLRHEIQFHKGAIAAIETVLLPSAGSKKLKVHFQTVLPHFRRHLENTIKVATALGYYSE